MPSEITDSQTVTTLSSHFQNTWALMDLVHPTPSFHSPFLSSNFFFSFPFCAVGNRSNSMEIYIYMIYYKEVAHLIMEKGKSKDLQGELESWRPRRANDLVPVQVSRPMNQENQWYSLELAWKLAGLEPMSHFMSGSRKKQGPSSETCRQEEFSHSERVSL